MKHIYYPIILFFFYFSFSACSQAQDVPLKTSYGSPATEWESEALPIGNGHMGAMIFGGVEQDLIQLNEHSLWSGGPGKNANYNGGHLGTPEVNHRNLQNLRNALQDKMTLFTETQSAYIDESGKVIADNYSAESSQLQAYINALVGTKNDFGSYQSLGNINIGHLGMTNPEIINITGDCNNPSNSGERFPALFDGSVNTKWFSDTGFKGFPCYIQWEYDSSFSVSAYTLTSGNDMQARDPKSWKLYGSNNGTDFTEIDSRTGITFPDRTQSIRFALSKTETYKHFKFEILETHTANTPPQLSEIALENTNLGEFPEYTNYRRELNLDEALSTVSYTQEGVNYKREYFASHPDDVVVIRLSADKPGKLSRMIWLTTPQTRATITAADGTIKMTGRPSDHREDGLKFAQFLQVIPAGGTMTTENGRVEVENADEILIITSSATNYRQCMDDSFDYFSDVNPEILAEATVNKVKAKSFDDLYAAHRNDYQSLYDRMSITLPNAVNTHNKTTDELLEGYINNANTDAENRYLEMVYYQFGRYLLISSSREGGLPANLQGIWAEGLTPPWSADYHTNINIQMNYWLAEQTNLSECHIPMLEYTKSLVPRGELSAQRYYCKENGEPVRGWVIHHENNIWGNTAPGNYYWGFYFPAAAGWMCQHLWEHYQFTQDKEFLEEYYPIILDAALFWVDNLWRDKRDGTLVANPSYSPEHGPYSLGASSDQAIICELFDMAIKAGEALGESSTEIDEIKAAKYKLAGPQIGLAGQFMEWKDEIQLDITGDGKHRHANHLFWLHPGSQIVAGRSAEDNLYVEAMKNTLNTRTDEGTGWSKAWKINFWARLHDGNRSHKLLEEQLKNSTLVNLFDTHPPFQIDGNFGATSGMTEMLVQSQGGWIELLPALPDVWATGSFEGIKARGNFELDADWTDKKLSTLTILSNSGKECTLKYPGIRNATLTGYAGTVEVTVIDDNMISFPTHAGLTYTLTF